MQDPDKMPGNLGGWSNVNLVTNDLGESLPNGYKRVTVDYTPTDFEAGAVYGLRFFIALAEQGPDFGVLFDNVRVSEILGDASTPGTKPPDNNQNNNPPVTSPNGGDGTTSPDGSAPEITDPDGSLPSGGALPCRIPPPSRPVTTPRVPRPPTAQTSRAAQGKPAASRGCPSS